MAQAIRLCLVLHNHQPIGNFHHVIQQAYDQGYAPFLDVFEPYSEFKISLHTSGPLMEWLQAEQPSYVDRLAALVRFGRVEILGGAFYEPILTMIPSRDRTGQIELYTKWLHDRFGSTIQGLWTPERVWEQSLTRDYARAGIRYTVLDDFHFRNAGLTGDDLFDHYVTEDEGYTTCVFSGSERLRYLIPFAEPHETIDYLRDVASRRDDAVVVVADDGEKFGVWPNTNKHVYQDGWLRRFFDLLAQNRDWITTCSLAEAFDSVPPAGKIYLPEGSYREMTEWALPVSRQRDYDRLARAMRNDPHWNDIRQFIRGGFWRNFKVKYPETNEMYARMMAVSQRLAAAEAVPLDATLLRAARQELYRGQCNCSYWHGAFGGLYLPHLRNAVYHHLIAADNLLDEAEGLERERVHIVAGDFDFDAKNEVRLENNRLIAFVAPHRGGQLYELDVRSIRHNLLATLDRRPEIYHDGVRQGPSENTLAIAAISDKIVFKQEGLDKRLQYDTHRRKGLVDHFFSTDATLAQLIAGSATEFGDFVDQPFEARLMKNPGRMQVRMTRTGRVGSHFIRVTKGITLESRSSVLEIAYLLENLPPQETLHFAIEFNLAGLPPQQDDRYFFGSDGTRWGHLGSALDLNDISSVGLADEWLGLRLQLHGNRDMHVWTYPIETVSQSEGGFELVHQSVALIPHWQVRADADGRWSVTLMLDVDTALAESRIVEQLSPIAQQ